MNRRRGRASGTISSRHPVSASSFSSQQHASGKRVRTNEGSSEAQSAKTGSDPTAAHGLSAARLLKESLSMFPQKHSTPRPRPLFISLTPTYHQRTRRERR